jgi:capsular exopolysaccharide synthesis family protein
MLGVAVGVMLAGGIVFLVEYLDDSVRSPEEISQAYDLPTLGFIAKIPKSRKNEEGVYILNNPRSPVAEAFRSLRTNIEFAGIVEPIKTILVTSPGPEEGKSTVTTNLAAVMMQGGKRVVVVDCDLRRPKIHRLLGMKNRMGLSGLFRGQANLNDVVEKRLNNLFVVTSGAVPPNPAELLGSKLMDKLIASLSNMVDLVIIDSPPVVVTDPVVLSTKVDGVILVINPGKTKKDALKATMTQLERAEARVLGVVVNRIGKNASYYYEYYYPQTYYTSNQKAN